MAGAARARRGGCGRRQRPHRRAARRRRDRAAVERRGGGGRRRGVAVPPVFLGDAARATRAPPAPGGLRAAVARLRAAAVVRTPARRGRAPRGRAVAAGCAPARAARSVGRDSHLSGRARAPRSRAPSPPPPRAPACAAPAKPELCGAAPRPTGHAPRTTRGTRSRRCAIARSAPQARSCTRTGPASSTPPATCPARWASSPKGSRRARSPPGAWRPREQAVGRGAAGGPAQQLQRAQAKSPLNFRAQ
jgi:hypothetical protein